MTPPSDIHPSIHPSFQTRSTAKPKLSDAAEDGAPLPTKAQLPLLPPKKILLLHPGSFSSPSFLLLEVRGTGGTGVDAVRIQQGLHARWIAGIIKIKALNNLRCAGAAIFTRPGPSFCLGSPPDDERPVLRKGRTMRKIGPPPSSTPPFQVPS